MSKPWCDFLTAKGAKVFAIEGLGGGTLSDQTAKAEAFLETLAPELENGFHAVGHSAGGLIAWGLASHSKWKDKVISLTTMATPHKGARLAETYMERFGRHSRSKILERVGYQPDLRFNVFNDFTRESVKAFKEKYSVGPAVKIASYSFSISPREMTWPIRLAHFLGLRIPDLDNDGFIELESQTEGHSLGHYKLDHLSQIGYHLYLNPRQKAEKTKLFNEIGESLVKHLEEVEKVR